MAGRPEAGVLLVGVPENAEEDSSGERPKRRSRERAEDEQRAPGRGRRVRVVADREEPQRGVADAVLPEPLNFLCGGPLPRRQPEVGYLDAVNSQPGRPLSAQQVPGGVGDPAGDQRLQQLGGVRRQIGHSESRRILCDGRDGNDHPIGRIAPEARRIGV